MLSISIYLSWNLLRSSPRIALERVRPDRAGPCTVATRWIVERGGLSYPRSRLCYHPLSSLGQVTAK
eukprot:scaffold37504_cov58-Phaeocystis_antarctica.AAC.4